MSESQTKRRRSRHELRSLMMDAGQEVLAELPATLGFEDLTYASVFRHVAKTRGEKLFRSSVHQRIWANQREFQLDVVAEAARHSSLATYESFASTVREFLASTPLSSAEDRRYATREAIRLGQNANWRTTYLDARYDLHRKIRQSAAALDADDPELAVVVAALEEEHQRRIALYCELIDFGMAEIGLRVRAEYHSLVPGAQVHIAEGAAAVVDGFALDIATQGMRSMPTGRTGELQDWYPASFGVWSYLSALLELDDDSLSAPERRL